MKGVFFTKFLEMVEERYSDDVVDFIIEASNLPNDGAYTSIGNYSYKELVQLVVNLNKATNIEIPILLESYGHYLLQSSSNFYLNYFTNDDKSFDFHKAVEDSRRRFVRNTNPDVQQAAFKRGPLKEKPADSQCISERPFAHLIDGIIKECLIHNPENPELKKTVKSKVKV